MVFKGSFQGRAVAVKRLLNDFVTLASREVTLLQESDAHPNVIRYYFQEARNNFHYIALELCPASLADIIERPDNPNYTEINCNFDPKKALSQISSGMRWLHGLKIVHRDIKPQNILVAQSQSNRNSKGVNYRMLISDFGLCKKLGVDETSFLPTVHGAMAAGTVGWRAPEILRGEVKIDDSSLDGSDETSQSSRGSTGTVIGTPTTPGNRTRLTKSVDIFALGCLFYYTLTSGGHPFGERYEREGNIFKGTSDLSGLEAFGEEGMEAIDLIGKMIADESSARWVS
jgi:serine/threonine-protein kinase/endoribonuclease IRE1